MVVEYRTIAWAGGSVAVYDGHWLGAPRVARSLGALLKGPALASRPRFLSWKASYSSLRPPSPSDFELAGLSVYTVKTSGFKGIVLPLWMPALLFAIWPAAVLARRRWWAIIERSRQGLCPTCAYDLRATVGRCPECGLEPRPLAAMVPAWFRLTWAALRARATACFGWMAFYLALGILYETLLGVYVGSEAVFAELLPIAVLLVIGGAFHAAGSSRSREAFLCYGSLGGLLLSPALVMLASHFRLLTTGWTYALAVVGCVAPVVLIGFVTRWTAMLRWHLLGRKTSRAALAVNPAAQPAPAGR